MSDIWVNFCKDGSHVATRKLPFEDLRVSAILIFEGEYYTYWRFDGPSTLVFQRVEPPIVIE